MTARVLVVGLDAGDPATVRALAAAGRMPVLARLLAEGAQHPVTEPRGGTYPAERWTSMVTGVGPATHGYSTWARYDTGRDGDHAIELDPAGVPRVWDVLSAAGRRVAVLDVPRQPPADVNGTFLFEWASHDRTVGMETSPASLVEELESRFGEHALAAARTDRVRHIATCDVILWDGRGHRSNEQQRRLRDLIQASVATKAQASEHLLDTEPWDLFFTVFGETHCVTHQFWHLHEPASPRDRESRALLGNPVDDTFTTIDASIGRHLELAGPDATTIVILHTGMCASRGGNQLLPALVARLDDGPALLTCSFPSSDGLRLLVAGRDPGGTIAPSDVATVVARVREALLALVDDATGRPAVRAVPTRAELVPGLTDDDRLPDLIVQWDGDRVIEQVSSPELGTVRAERIGARTGEHTPDGLVIVHGPGVEPGVHDAMDAAELAPRIAALLDVPYPRADSLLTASTSSS